MTNKTPQISSLEWKLLGIQCIRTLPSIILITYIVWKWISLDGYLVLLEQWGL